MAFTFAAFCYIVALILTAVLIFFAIFHIIAFDELKTDYKNPIDQCSSLNPLVLPEYFIHMLFTFLFLCSFQFGSLLFNLPLAVYHVHRHLYRDTNQSFTAIQNSYVSSKPYLALLQEYDAFYESKEINCKYMTRPVMSGPGLYDPTSIMNADQLNRAQKEGWIKLAFYLLSFFYYLYSMIYVLVSST